MPEQQPIRKNKGVTKTERYLKRLCDKTFLSLWSYPSVYTDKRESLSPQGKELCDLLVVFENNIIIFSDKQCSFPRTGNLELDWNRWYRKAVLQSAKQAWGAERWIRKFPDRIFLDNKCTVPFPIKMPDGADMKIHIVIVAHEVSARCREAYGGSGSLMSRYSVPKEMMNLPFVISDIDKSKTFIHVLDDTTLDVILKNNNTVSDLLSYLTKKEKFLRSETSVIISGEEDLLAYYLQGLNDQGEHDFVVDKEYRSILLSEGGWEEFQNNPRRIAQIEAEKVSYFWDALIERFSGHVLDGTQYFSLPSGVHSAEQVLKFLAREPRLHRRFLSKRFLEFVQQAPLEKSSKRYLLPQKLGEPHYVFLLFPRLENDSEDHYREMRRNTLVAYCMALKNRIPEAMHIVGIATETGINSMSSEDAIYFDVREWSDELRQKTKEMMADLNIPYDLPSPKYATEKEYPLLETIKADPFKNPRNKLCPCGSGKKYKKCHGK